MAQTTTTPPDKNTPPPPAEQTPEPTRPTPHEALQREFKAAVAALVIAAGTSLCGYALDINNNEASKEADGSVRLSLAQRDGSHERIWLIVPETLTLEVAERE